MPPPAIDAVDLTKRFGRTAAVDGADLRVEAGELVALLGPSGSGKTTLLRLVAGFEVPDAGRVAIGGRTVAGAGVWAEPDRRRIGMVFQDGALFPHLTVAANLEFGRPRAGRVGECLELVGLAARGSAYPHELSGGERQRVALARALAADPEVVLLDEPFTALDEALREELREEVAQILRAAGASALLVTHSQQEALSLADVVAVMRDGRVVQVGPPEEVYGAPADRWVAEFLGDADVVAGHAVGGTADTELGRFPAPGLHGRRRDRAASGAGGADSGDGWAGRSAGAGGAAVVLRARPAGAGRAGERHPAAGADGGVAAVAAGRRRAGAGHRAGRGAGGRGGPRAGGRAGVMPELATDPAPRPVVDAEGPAGPGPSRRWVTPALLLGCVGLAAAVAAVAGDRRLRPVGVADLGPRADAGDAELRRDDRLEAAPGAGDGAARAVRGGGAAAVAAGVAGGGAVGAGGGRGPGGPAGTRRPRVGELRDLCTRVLRSVHANSLSVPEARRDGRVALVGAVAAVVAVAAFLLTPDAEARWLRHWLQGNIEPVTAALCVWAVRRHLDGRPGQAVLLGALAGLTRPEAWPFLVLYAAWLLWRAPRRWWVLVPALPVVPLLWFGGDRLASGNALAGAATAQVLVGTAAQRLVVGLDGALAMVPVAVWVAAAVAVVWGAHRRRLAPALLAAAALAWAGLVAAMAARFGYAAIGRFYAPAAALLCVLAGVAVGWLAGSAWAQRPVRASRYEWPANVVRVARQRRWAAACNIRRPICTDSRVRVAGRAGPTAVARAAVPVVAVAASSPPSRWPRHRRRHRACTGCPPSSTPPRSAPTRRTTSSPSCGGRRPRGPARVRAAVRRRHPARRGGPAAPGLDARPADGGRPQQPRQRPGDHGDAHRHAARPHPRAAPPGRRPAPAAQPRLGGLRRVLPGRTHAEVRAG